MGLKYCFAVFLILSFSSALQNLGIIGGRNAVPGEFPYQVYFTLDGIDSWFFLCGGIILSPSWILSAASCANNSLILHAMVGVTNLTDINEINQTVTVDKFIVHPNFDKTKSLNDISLMKLATPLEYDEFVQPATIASAKTDSFSGNGTFSGFGVKGGFNPYPNNLQVLDVNIISFEDCKTALDKIKDDKDYDVHPAAIAALENSTKICAGPLDDFMGSCFGDEGSPLTKDGVVIGVASFIIESCGREYAPSIFSRVSAYTDWIKENVDEDINIL